MIKLIAEGTLRTKFGEFTEYLFYDGQKESIALVKGDIRGASDVLCRIHSHCLTAHVFNSIECDCREQMELAQKKIEEEGRGLIVWLDQVGKDNGHMAELLSANLKAEGVPQTEAYQRLGYIKDARSFARAAEIIRSFDIASVKLMTNSPQKIKGLTDGGVKVSGIQEIYVAPDNPDLHKTYLDKVNNQGHLIKL